MTRKSLPDSYVEDIQEDASGNLWIRTGSGYAIYNSASDVFDRNVEAWMWNVGLTGNPSLIYIDKEKTSGSILMVKVFTAIERNRKMP